MSMVERLALVLGFGLLVVAAAVIFVPASPSGATCGTWLAPEWDNEKTQEIIDRAETTYEGASAMGADGLASDALNIAVSARRSHDLCADALSTRRVVSIVLLVLGVVVPGAVLFVGGARRRPDPNDPVTS